MENALMTHPAALTPEEVPDLPPAVLEELRASPDAFGELLRPFHAQLHWDMINDFKSMTMAQRIDYLRLGADLTGVKNVKKEAAPPGPAFSINITIPNAPTPTQSVIIEGTATPVTDSE